MNTATMQTKRLKAVNGISLLTRWVLSCWLWFTRQTSRTVTVAVCIGKAWPWIRTAQTHLGWWRLYQSFCGRGRALAKLWFIWSWSIWCCIVLNRDNSTSHTRSQVKWFSSCLSEHRLDCPGQMPAVYQPFRHNRLTMPSSAFLKPFVHPRPQAFWPSLSWLNLLHFP